MGTAHRGSIRRAGLFQNSLLGYVLIDTRANIGTVTGQYVESPYQFMLGIRLQDIAASAGAEGATHQFGRGMQREQQNLGVRQHVANNACGLQAIQTRHGDVHDDNFRFYAFGKPDSFLAVLCFAAKFPLGKSMEYALNTAANHGVVIDNDYSWHAPFLWSRWEGGTTGRSFAEIKAA